MMRMKYCAWFVAISAGALVTSLQPRAHQAAPSASPRLINTCLITANVDHLVTFYEGVLQMKAERI